MVTLLTELLCPPETGGAWRGYMRSSQIAWQIADREAVPGFGAGLPASTTLDLSTPAALARLRHVALVWSGWAAEDQIAWLRRQDIALPPRLLTESDIAIMPGGAVAIRGPEGIVVCDPVEALSFTESETRRLRTALRRRADAVHLLHTDNGVEEVAQLPKSLPPQAVTIVPEASRLPGRASMTGPALVQWCLGGAVAWPMVAAPAAFALAGSVSAVPVTRGDEPVVTEHWHAPDLELRCRLLGPGIAEHASDLLTDEVTDELRHAIVEACLSNRNSLVRRIAIGLAMLPACFHADATLPPGGQPAAWKRGIARVRQAAQVLLGVENIADPLWAIRVLRNLLEHTDALVFAELGDTLLDEPVSLWEDAALFLGRRTPPNGRIAVIVPVLASPVDLYALASTVATSLRTPVTAVAPCWGFCHRIAPDGTEAGNAAWFGMGAGLDEMDVLIGDIDGLE